MHLDAQMVTEHLCTSLAFYKLLFMQNYRFSMYNSVHTLFKVIRYLINRSKDWALVQNAALVIEIKVLKLVYVC